MKRSITLVLAALVAPIQPASASGQIYYGSRAGMTVTVVSMRGLDTTRAVIRTKHTEADAIGFCRDYVGKVTQSCIRDELAVPLNDEIRADCIKGIFTDFGGAAFRFKGPNKDPNSMAKYAIVDAQGKIADGSSASGYPVNIGLFKALCPRRAPIDD